LGGVWPLTATAVDLQSTWRYGTDPAAGSRGPHMARIEQADGSLTYSCDGDRGRRFTVNVWRAGEAPTALHQDRLALTFIFAQARDAGRIRRIAVTARPVDPAAGAVIEGTDAHALLLALIEGSHDRLTIEAAGLRRDFPLAGAAAMVRRANVACSTSLPPATAMRDPAWDRFSYGGLFEIDMPDGAEEVAATIPMQGRVVRYGGIRSSDGHATYTAIVTDSGQPIASVADQRRFAAEFVAGTIAVHRGNGAAVADQPVSGGDGLAHDLRIDHANGATQSMRIVMATGRLYVLTATFHANAQSLTRKDRFIESFRPL
jgi:hypothetical protein